MTGFFAIVLDLTNRKKTRQRFIHYIGKKLKQGTSIRSLIMTIGRIDTV